MTPTGHPPRRRGGPPHRRRPLVGLVVAGLAALAIPASVAAQTGDDSSRTDRRPTDPAPPVEVLHLRCGARPGDDGAAVGCAWSTPTSDAAAGLRLWRIAVGTDQGRAVVFRTEDVTVGEYVDAPVRRGVRYAYVIQAVGATGRTVGLSRAVHVAVPPPRDERPDVEVLRLECRVTDDHGVGCTWTLPTGDRARTLTLWRSIDRGPREQVLSAHQPFPSAYRDTVPDGTHRAAYAVVATDGAGRVVARSRAAIVTFRDARPVVRPDTRPDVRPDVRPDPRPDVRPDVRPDPRPDVRPDVRPDPPADVRPIDRAGGAAPEGSAD